MPIKLKSREARLRRAATRRGLALIKSRRKDPGALDYGRYSLHDPYSNTVVFGIGARGMPEATLDEIEAYLMREKR